MKKSSLFSSAWWFLPYAIFHVANFQNTKIYHFSIFYPADLRKMNCFCWILSAIYIQASACLRRQSPPFQRSVLSLVPALNGLSFGAPLAPRFSFHLPSRFIASITFALASSRLSKQRRRARNCASLSLLNFQTLSRESASACVSALPPLC